MGSIVQVEKLYRATMLNTFGNIAADRIEKNIRIEKMHRLTCRGNEGLPASTFHLR